MENVFICHLQQISAQRLQQKVGNTIDILIDEVDSEGAIGRSHSDAPEIDGLVYVNNAEGLSPGDMIKRTVTAADDYDLWSK